MKLQQLQGQVQQAQQALPSTVLLPHRFVYVPGTPPRRGARPARRRARTVPATIHFGVEAFDAFAGVSSRLDGGASDECDGADVADAAFRDNQWVARVVGFDDARWGERDESRGEISER